MAELTAAHAANAMETYFLGGVDIAVPTDTFLARLAGNQTSPFESKFRLFAAGRWPLGVVGSRLFLF